MFSHVKTINFFLTIKGCDVELTNIKILDKNIVPSVGTGPPEGGSFLPLF